MIKCLPPAVLCLICVTVRAAAPPQDVSGLLARVTGRA